MTYEEAMKLLDAGRIVSIESEWVMRKAGFAWGNWYNLQRCFTQEDIKRDEQRSINGDWTAPPIESSGPLQRTLNTLCETVAYPSNEDWERDVPQWMKDATDWVDVTDRFEHGSPKGWREHMYPELTDATD